MNASPSLSRLVKTPEEIERLARGGALLRSVLHDIVRLAGPGVTGRELDREAEKRLRALGAEPSFKGFSSSGDPDDAFPATLCVSINSAVVHGLPTTVPFHAGDIVGLDLGCRFDGLYTDTAVTIPIGSISEAQRQLLAVTRTSLVAGLSVVKAGVTTGDIGSAIQSVVDRAGYSVVRDLVGHGVGYEVHEEPHVPNYGVRGEGVTLPAGAVIAIEPMVIMGKHHIEVAPDGWTVIAKDGTLAAHEEVTVAVTEDGVRLLTIHANTLWSDGIAPEAERALGELFKRA